MKRKIYLIEILFICALTHGCTKATTKETAAVDSPKIVVENDTFYTAWGNEPGWRVQLIKDPVGKMTYDLLLDYGEKHLVGTTNKLPSPGENMAVHFVLISDTKPLILSITDEPCTDDADKQYETTVSLSDQKFVLNGCGSYRASE